LPSASAWVWLRIRSDNTAFDAELQGLIDAAKQDLRRRGIKAADNDPLIKQAVKMYCKANFGYGGSDAEQIPRKAMKVTKFYADGIVYYVCQSNNGYSGDFEVAMFPEQMMLDIWGMNKKQKRPDCRECQRPARQLRPAV
jgi:hypothetical protein